MRTNLTFIPIVLVLAITIAVIPATAQTSNATVLGTVNDSSGAVIVGAAIRVQNADTGIDQSAVADAEGRFRISGLSIGRYNVEASSPGFATIIHKDVILRVGSQTVVNFSLEVGPPDQTIYVEAVVSTVETFSAALKSMIDERQIRQLPLNGRNFTELISMTASVAPAMGMAASNMQVIYGAGNSISDGGARAEGQSFLLDNTNIQGFWNRGVGSAATGNALGIEALAEVELLTSSYSAQFGGNGIVVNAVTKSGGNTFHGTVYEFLRNSALDARNFFDVAADPPPYRRNQFGFSLGGPIKEGSLFFFSNYEGMRESRSQNALAFVPDLNTRSSNSIDPRITPLLDLYPLPNGRNLGGGVAESRTVGHGETHQDYFVGRGDWTVSSRDSVSVRYVADRAKTRRPFGLGLPIPLWPEDHRTTNQFFTVESRRVVAPSLSNSLRFSFVRPVETAQSTRPDAQINVGGLSAIGSSPFLPFASVQNRFTYADDAAWTRRNHNLQFGVAVERLQTGVNSPSFAPGLYNFNNIDQFLRAIPAMFQGVAPGNVNATRDFREIDVTTYINNEWQPLPRITLNMGLRYELGSNPVGVRHSLYALTEVPDGTAFEKVTHAFRSSPNKKNWDPRFGFAWDPLKDHRLSVRGGFGIFHNRVAPRTYAKGYTSNPPFLSTSVMAPSFPYTFPTTARPPVINTTNAVSYDADNAPYQMEWNLNIQREVIPATVLSVGYVASRGVHLFLVRDVNPPRPIAGASGDQLFGTLTQVGVSPNPRLNPAFGRLNTMLTEGNSNYHSLQVSLKRSMTRRASAMAFYTWSKCIDNASGSYVFEEGAWELSNPYSARADRGPCTFDYRHSFRGNGIIALPFRGWQASAIVGANSGRPFSVTDGFDQAGFQNRQNSRPNTVEGCRPILGRVERWYDPNCFRLEPVGMPGNLGRNTLTAPGLWNTDVALMKETGIGESISLQLRAEVFNIFNHANFGLPDGDLFVPDASGGATVSPTAGRVTTTATPARQIQFGLKVVF